MSATARPAAAWVSGISSGGWPVMPSEVAFTSKAKSARAAARWSQGTVRAGGSMAANASARSAERLQRVTGVPASCRAAAMARAAPPAPRMRAGPRSGATLWARRLARKPAPSVFRPVMPVVSKTSVLTAPARAALGCRWAHRASAACLCGRVRLAPTKPSSGSDCRRAASWSGGVGRRRYSPLMLWRLSHSPWMRGEREWPTGQPMTPARLGPSRMRRGYHARGRLPGAVPGGWA